MGGESEEEVCRRGDGGEDGRGCVTLLVVLSRLIGQGKPSVQRE